ncbi:hypothetical protein D3C79_772670 [compost metagenome]
MPGRRHFLQARDLYPTTEKDEHQSGCSRLEQFSCTDDCLQRLRLTHISSEQNPEPRVIREVVRPLGIRRPYHVFGAPVINHVDLLRGDAALDQQALETRRQDDNLIDPFVNPVTHTGNDPERFLIGKHPRRPERVRPHILNVIDHRHTPQQANEGRGDTNGQWRMVGVYDIGFLCPKQPVEQAAGSKTDVIEHATNTTLPVTRV